MRRALVAAAVLMAAAGCASNGETSMDPLSALPSASARAPISLEGGVWVVEDVNGGGIPDRARLDFRIDPGDSGASRIVGRSGCNRFTGGWTQNGASVRVAGLGGTRMACSPALIDIEAKFLKALGDVETYSADATGAVVLRTADGRVIRARREPSQPPVG